jgi:hypothetical protein
MIVLMITMTIGHWSPGNARMGEKWMVRLVLINLLKCARLPNIAAKWCLAAVVQTASFQGRLCHIRGGQEYGTRRELVRLTSGR